MGYKHTLCKHVGVRMTGNYCVWVQGMMEHHRAPNIFLRWHACRRRCCSHRYANCLPLQASLCCSAYTHGLRQIPTTQVREHFLIGTCSVPWLRKMYLNFESWFLRPWCDDVSSIRKVLGVGESGIFVASLGKWNLFPTLSGASVASRKSVCCIWRSPWCFQKHGYCTPLVCLVM